MKSAKFDEYYREGKPLFTRAALLDIATQMSSGQPFIHLDDFHGLSRPQQRSRVPDWQSSGELAAHEWSCIIDYNSYEELTRPVHPYDEWETDEERDYNPLEISYTRSHGDNFVHNNLDQIRANFNTHGDTWLASQECKDIVQPLLSQSTPKIRKIVAFALGSLARADGDVVPRWTIQHALILAIANALQKAYGHEIRCFSQEPLYTDDDKISLGEKGVTVLEDPMAWLEVDEETLVISIAPNVCVKQIITDLTRPAVMMWDEVVARDPAENVWKTELMDGVETLVAPYTTDPNSPRVCEMIKKSYHKIPLVGNNQHFGRMTTYIRMDDPSYPAAVQKEDFGLKT